MAGLWDYFWIHKLQFRFIYSILVQYESANSSSTLIAPSLVSQHFNLSSIVYKSTWSLLYSGGVLGVSKRFDGGDWAVRLSLVFDSDILLGKYGIVLSDFVFSESSFRWLKDEESHYEV